MYIRVAQVNIEPSKVDDVLAVVRDAGLPNMRQFPGFHNAYVGVDRTGGRGLVVSTWDTLEHASFTNAPDFIERLQAAGMQPGAGSGEGAGPAIYEVTDQT